MLMSSKKTREKKTETHAKNQRIANRHSKREIKTKRIATNAGTRQGITIKCECTAASGIRESKIAKIERRGLSLSLLREIEAVNTPEIALREVSLVRREQIVESSGEVGALGR
jgi:site-specific DNA-cytosine methylase